MFVPLLYCDNPQCGAKEILQNNSMPPTWLTLSPGGVFCSYDCVAEHCLGAITELKAHQAAAAEATAHEPEAAALVASSPT